MVFPDLDIPFDEEGNAQLILNDELGINLTRKDDENRLLLAAPIASELKEDITYSEVLDLLNLAIGPLMGNSPAIGRDPISGMIIGYASINYGDISQATWPEILAGFIGFIQGVAEKLN